MPRLARGFLWLVGLGALALLAIVAVMWVDHRSATELPPPTGSLPIGRAIEVWSDEAIDPLAPTPGTRRELMVWIWYPSVADSPAPVDDYLPADLRAATNRMRGALIGNVLTRDLSMVRTHSRRHAELSARQPVFPVVLMRAGASAGVGNYSALAEDLASHGYVVVGFDAPYRSSVVVFPDGRTITRIPANDPERCLGRPDMEACAERLLAGWTADLKFVLDRLEQMNNGATASRFRDRLDLTKVGAFGHSFGGAAAALFCAEDARCKAAVNIDGAPHGRVIRDGLRQPFLFLLSDHGAASDPESREIIANIQSQYEHLPADSRHRVAISGASHFLFSDDGALLKSPVAQGLLRTAGMLRIDGRRQLAATSYCLDSFFDAYLKGTPAHPQFQTALYPEITLIH